ncbi:MAG: hypothetical protein ACK2UP_15345, partial [Candidatus Promineifilaceae bacterium]
MTQEDKELQETLDQLSVLAPTETPYREVATFHDRSGGPGWSITLDGHGATISGADPLDPAAWEQVAGGLYRALPMVSPEPA